MLAGRAPLQRRQALENEKLKKILAGLCITGLVAGTGLSAGAASG